MGAMQRDIARVIDFWFGPEGSAERGKPRVQWWKKDPAFDAEVREQLGALHEQAASGALDEWAGEAMGSLALVILLDQVPRNLYRDSGRAFATDAQARAVTNRALSAGFDQAVAAFMRVFFYLPLEHSEDLADQERCVELVRALGDEGYLDFAIRHRDIVARFGRFPHRNAMMGRPSTPEEEAFLKEPNSSF